LQRQAKEEARQREAELQRQAKEEARQREAELQRQAKEEARQREAELQRQAKEEARQREAELQRQAKEEARQRQAEIERQAEEKAKQREVELQKQAKLKQLREQDETRVNNTKTKAESQKNLLEESSSKSNPFKNKKVLMFSGIGSAIAIIGISGTLFFGGQTSETTSATTKSDESLSVLIDKKDYLQAGAKYPKQYEKIEQSIIDNMKDETIRKDLESLEKFNDKYPTANGNLDMAFFKKDWKEIVRVYEKYQDHIDLNENRKMMLGYGYFKTRDSNNDHLAKAEKISNELKDKGLKNKIADNQIAQATIDNLTNEIEKSNLSPEEKEQKTKTREAVIQKQKEL
jgi:hypothetical protein